MYPGTPYGRTCMPYYTHDSTAVVLTAQAWAVQLYNCILLVLLVVYLFWCCTDTAVVVLQYLGTKFSTITGYYPGTAVYSSILSKVYMLQHDAARDSS